MEGWAWPDSLDALSAAAPESHRLLFENDDVRVLETRIAPGETTGLHTHRWPGTLHVLSFDHVVRRPTGAGERSLERLVPAHTLENVGAADIHVIEVELKHPRPD